MAGLPIFSLAGVAVAIEAHARDNFVPLLVLAYFDFRDKPMALWGGEFDFDTALANGKTLTWLGLGKSGALVSIAGLDANADLDSSDMTFKVSGVDADILHAFKDEDRADYVGRMCGVAVQFCDATWKPRCPPLWVRAGIMGDATIDRAREQDGSWTRTISLPASNIFFGRGTARASYYTDRDQQMRHPGDKFFQFVSTLQDASIPVPWHR